MALRQINTFFEVEDKVQMAIDRLKHYAPHLKSRGEDKFYVAFSGGKDSVVLLDIVKRAGVPYEAVYNVTTVDPPELVRFIKKEYPEVRCDRPEKSMFQMIVKKGFPIRQKRWCCEYFKERSSGTGRLVVTGIRAAESFRRSQRKLFEPCYQNRGRKVLRGEGTYYLNPILDYTVKDVWEYIKTYNVTYSPLYDERDAKGNRLWKRLGCIMCPMGTAAHRKREGKRWPKMYNAYAHAFQRLLDRWAAEGTHPDYLKNFPDGNVFVEWWISSESLPGEPETCGTIFDLCVEEEEVA